MRERRDRSFRGLTVNEQTSDGIARQKEDQQSGQSLQITDADRAEMVVAQVQAAEVGQGDVVQTCDVTTGQAEVDQQCVLRQGSQRQPAVTGVEVAQLQVFFGQERLTADKGQAKARALRGAGQLTELLVVMLWTLDLNVTNVFSVKTLWNPNSGKTPDTCICRSPLRPRGPDSR